jgi:phospholipase/carboxylesterase
MHEMNLCVRDYSNGNPKNIVFILHGYGADAENLSDLPPYFSQSLESPLFILPDAPFPYENMPHAGRQWFSLNDRSEQNLIEGAENAQKFLLPLIENTLQKYSCSYENLVLMGFSQGAMMSIFMALKLPATCKGVVCFSGTTVSVDEMISSVQSKPPFCVIHGSEDEVVPCGLGKFTAKALKQIGCNVNLHEIRHLGHSINDDCIEIACDFLENL